MAMTGGKKRTYSSILEPLVDLGHILKAPVRALAVVGGKGLSHTFRERLMLTVTGVNDCRYCTFLHSRLGKAAGLSAEEIQALLNGRLDGIDDHELPAVQYALHWAESGGQADVGEWEALVEFYGKKTARRIETALRMIRIGNLTGNTFDRLFRRNS